ncbi:MAG: hypothetical protein AAF823_14925 [Planctomycetota bacterium]
MRRLFRVARQSMLAALVLATSVAAAAYVISWSEVAWLGYGRIDGTAASVMAERGRLLVARTHTATDRHARSHALTLTRAPLPDRPLALHLFQSPGMTHLTAGPIDYRHAHHRVAALEESFTALCLRLEPLIATLLALTWLTAPRPRRTTPTPDPAPEPVSPVSPQRGIATQCSPPAPQP